MVQQTLPSIVNIPINDFRLLSIIHLFYFINMNDILYDDLVNVSVCVMRNNATTSNTCPACSNKGSGIPSG